MRTSKSYLVTVYSDKGVSYHHLCFVRDSQAGRGVGELYSGKKERCQVHPDWRLLLWGSCRGLSRSGVSYVIC